MRARATRGKLIYENLLCSVAMVWENATRGRLSSRLLTAAEIRGKHIRSSFVPHCTTTCGVLVKIDYSPRHVCPSVRIPPYRFLWNLVYGTSTKICEIIPIVVKTYTLREDLPNLKYLIVIHIYNGVRVYSQWGTSWGRRNSWRSENNRVLSIANHLICNVSTVAMCQLWLFVDQRLRHGEVLHCVLCKTCKDAFSVFSRV